jgi:hypothetical protein
MEARRPVRTSSPDLSHEQPDLGLADLDQMVRESTNPPAAYEYCWSQSRRPTTRNCFPSRRQSAGVCRYRRVSTGDGGRCPVNE